MRARIGSALLAVTVGFADLAVGQDANSVRLTLEEALSTAEGSNPAYRQAVNNAQLNGVEMRTTWLDQLLPNASLTLRTSYTGNLQRNSLDFFGNPVENPTADWEYFSNTTQNLNLSWSFQGPSLFQAYRRQSLVNEARELTQRRTLTDVQAEVRLLYMDALEQLELLESEREILEARRVDQDVSERLFTMGVKNRVEVLRAELEVEQQALALQTQQGSYETALLELRSALGTDDERPIELVPEPLPIFDPSGIHADALVDRALEVNPTLLESEVQIQTAEVGLAQERSAWWPDVSFGISVYRRSQLRNADALFDPAFDEDLESNFGVQLSFPIVNDFFATRQRTEQAAVDLRNQRELDREARLEVEKTVRGAVLQLGNQYESLRIVERSAEIAQEALRLARERYRLGTGTFEELRTSALEDANTRRQVITARHAFVEALLMLEQAVGGPVRPEEG